MAVRLAAAAQFNEPRHCRDPLFGQIPPNVELLSALETSADGRLPIADCRTRVSKHEHERTGEQTTERATKRTSAHCIALTFALNLLRLCCCSSLTRSANLHANLFLACSLQHKTLRFALEFISAGGRSTTQKLLAGCDADCNCNRDCYNYYTRLSLRGSERGSSSSSCNANQKCVQGNNFWKTYITLQTKERRRERRVKREMSERSFVYNNKLVDPLNRLELSGVHCTLSICSTTICTHFNASQCLLQIELGFFDEISGTAAPSLPLSLSRSSSITCAGARPLMLLLLLSRLSPL